MGICPRIDDNALRTVEISILNAVNNRPFMIALKYFYAPVCDKQIYGHGLDGYLEAIDFCLKK